MTNKLKLLISLFGTSLLAGCFGPGEVACDSEVTKSRITADFKSHLSSVLPNGAIDYISVIELAEITTLSADNDAKVHKCEAQVQVHSDHTDLFSYQNIQYTNQSVSGGKESSRTKYEFIDTFNYIGDSTYKLIKEPYETGIAKKEGFDSYDTYQRYKNAKSRITYNIDAIQQLEKDLKEKEEKKIAYGKSVKPVKDAIAEGKSVLLANQYFSMKPLSVKPTDIKPSGFDHAIKFTTELKNNSNSSFDTLYFVADVYLDESPQPFRTNKFVSTDLNGSIKPGQTKKVTFRVLTSDGIGKDFATTSTWKEAKRLRVHLLPYKYRDANGAEGEFGRKDSSFFSKEKRQPFLWEMYQMVETDIVKKKIEIEVKKKQTDEDKSFLLSVNRPYKST